MSIYLIQIVKFELENNNYIQKDIIMFSEGAIPNLPNDVTREILKKIGYKNISNVSKSWKYYADELLHHRREKRSRLFI